jgi:hypothetical protein
MSKEQALHLLVEAFNSKRKRMENGIELPYRKSSFVHTLRATLKFMILEKDLKENGKFNLKQFHEILSYGSAQKIH